MPDTVEEIEETAEQANTNVGDDLATLFGGDAADTVAVDTEKEAVVEGKPTETAEKEGGEGDRVEKPAPAVETKPTPEAKTETEKKPAPTPDPEAVEAQQRRAEEYEAWSRDFGDVSAKLEAGELDPLAEDGAKEINRALKVMAKGMKYVQQGVAQNVAAANELREARAADDFWQGWSADNPEVPAIRARKTFEEEVGKAVERYPTADANTLRAIAKENWERRITAMKAAKAPPAKPVATAVAPPPVAPRASSAGKAAQTHKPAPPAGGNVVVKPAPMKHQTVLEKARAGVYGAFENVAD